VLVVGAAALAAAGFLILRPDDETEGPARGSQQTGPTGAADRTTPAPTPAYTRISVRGGRPVGGVKTIEVDKGDTVRMSLASDAPEEFHVHGYERSVAVTPGRPARVRFPADVEGVFEVEAHRAGDVEVARLRVGP
jgi:FtsP/CotA-like multicopper oxidase with cupredoxin domain